MARTKPAPPLSQPGRRDLPVLAVLAVALAAATVWLIAMEWTPEYLRHQQAFRAAVARSQGESAARAVPFGIQQIWRQDTASANRCVTCHLAVTWKGFETAAEPLRTHPSEILRAHPVDRFGCTSCHGGQGWAVDRERAHGQVAAWPEPLLEPSAGRRAARRRRRTRDVDGGALQRVPPVRTADAGQPRHQSGEAPCGPEGLPRVSSYQRAWRPHRARPRLDRGQGPGPVPTTGSSGGGRARSAGTWPISRTRAPSCPTA